MSLRTSTASSFFPKGTNAVVRDLSDSDFTNSNQPLAADKAVDRLRLRDFLN